MLTNLISVVQVDENQALFMLETNNSQLNGKFQNKIKVTVEDSVR